MYTVQELIEALQECPKDYKVLIHGEAYVIHRIDSIGIDNNERTVDIFTE